MRNQTAPNVNRFSILNRFQSIRHNQELPYERLVAEIDEKCRGFLCDRSVIRELFAQCCTRRNTASIEAIIDKYIENLHGCHLALMREDIKLKQCQQRLQSLKSSQEGIVYTPFVFLEVLSANIHPHYSSSPIFSYKIQPSGLPPVTFYNFTSPTINDSYTLEIPDLFFEIVFLESGIEIARWRFQAEHRQSGREYVEHVAAEGLEVDLRVKYIHKGQQMNRELQQCHTELRQAHDRKQIAELAYQKLLEFEPFQRMYTKARPEPEPGKDQGILFKFTTLLITVMPCLQKHVRNCYYFSVILICFQALACIYCPTPLLNIILPVYIFGMVHTEQANKLWLVVLTQGLMIANSIFMLILSPKPYPPEYFRSLLVVELIGECIYLFLLVITTVRQSEFSVQIDQLLGVGPKQQQFSIVSAD